MPIIDALQTPIQTKQIFYEDVVAFYLRYPDAMFRPGSPGMPLSPDDFRDAYQYALGLQFEFPNMTRGNDVGWQNFATNDLFVSRTMDAPTQPTGPVQYKDLFGHLKKMQTQANNPKFPSRPPFLRISLKNLLLRNAAKLTSSNTIDYIEQALVVPGYLAVGSLALNRFTAEKKQYLKGPVPSFDEAYFQFTINDPMWKRFPYVLFAHQDICTTVPCKAITQATLSSDPTKKVTLPVPVYAADFSATTTDVNLMYTDLGLSYSDAPKVVVLKCFLHGHKAKGPIPLHHQVFKAMEATVDNDVSLQPLTYNYHLFQTVDAALNNLGDVLTGHSLNVKTPPDTYNAVFQGFYTTFDDHKTVMRIDTFARSAIHEICQTHDVDIQDYPKICACVGRGNEVADMRDAMHNTMYRPICNGADCLGDTEYKVFKYTPTLPCSQYTLCSQNINLGLTRSLKLKNVALNCDFPVEYVPLAGAGAATAVSKPTPLPPVPPHRTTGLMFGVMVVCLVLLLAFWWHQPHRQRHNDQD